MGFFGPGEMDPPDEELEEDPDSVENSSTWETVGDYLCGPA